LNPRLTIENTSKTIPHPYAKNPTPDISEWGAASIPDYSSIINRNSTDMLNIKGTTRISLSQWIDVEPGRLYMTTCHAMGHIAANNRILLSIEFNDKKYQPLKTNAHKISFPANQITEGMPIALLNIAPANASYARVKLTVGGQNISDSIGIEKISTRVYTH